MAAPARDYLCSRVQGMIKSEGLDDASGIGDLHADRIINERPYEEKDDITSDKVGVQQTPYEKIKDMIIAKQK